MSAEPKLLRAVITGRFWGMNREALRLTLRERNIELQGDLGETTDIWFMLKGGGQRTERLWKRKLSRYNSIDVYDHRMLDTLIVHRGAFDMMAMKKESKWCADLPRPQPKPVPDPRRPMAPVSGGTAAGFPPLQHPTIESAFSMSF